jgi:hypothetical protein
MGGTYRRITLWAMGLPGDQVRDFRPYRRQFFDVLLDAPALDHRPGTTGAVWQGNFNVVIDDRGYRPATAGMAGAPAGPAGARALGLVAQAEGGGLAGGLGLRGGQLFFERHNARVLGAQIFASGFQFVLERLILVTESLVLRQQSQHLLSLAAHNGNEPIGL